MTNKCALLISASKDMVKITSLDGSVIYYEGGEEQAWRIASYVGGIVGGGDLYAYYEGNLSEWNHGLRFTARDAAGLDTEVEIEIAGIVKKVSISWCSGT